MIYLMNRVIVMSENKARYLKTINFSAQLISVYQDSMKSNSPQNGILKAHKKLILCKLPAYLLEVYQKYLIFNIFIIMFIFTAFLIG